MYEQKCVAQAVRCGVSNIDGIAAHSRRSCSANAHYLEHKLRKHSGLLQL
jgi:hypothetical protein